MLRAVAVVAVTEFYLGHRRIVSRAAVSGTAQWRTLIGGEDENKGIRGLSLASTFPETDSIPPAMRPKIPLTQPLHVPLMAW